jgi:hypothetical protein
MIQMLWLNFFLWILLLDQNIQALSGTSGHDGKNFKRVLKMTEPLQLPQSSFQSECNLIYSVKAETTSCNPYIPILYSDRLFIITVIITFSERLMCIHAEACACAYQQQIFRNTI